MLDTHIFRKVRTFGKKRHCHIHENISTTEIGCMYGINFFCQGKKFGSYYSIFNERRNTIAVTYQADHVVQSLPGVHQVQVILHVHVILSHQVCLANLKIQDNLSNVNFWITPTMNKHTHSEQYRPLFVYHRNFVLVVCSYFYSDLHHNILWHFNNNKALAIKPCN